MNKLSTYIILLFFSVVFNSCYNQCRYYNYDNTFRGNTAVNYIPQITDTLVFASPTGQKFAFDKIIFVDRKILNDCDDCCTDAPDTTQERYIIYDSNLTSFKLKVMAFSDDVSDYLDVVYESKNPIDIFYHNENYTLTKSAKLTSVISPTNSIIAHQDTLSLNNKLFNDVYIFSQNVQTSKKFVSELYYTPSFGMVGYKLSDGVVWNLEN